MNVRDVPIVRFTGLSPKRHVKDFYDTKAPTPLNQRVIERRRRCSGNPVYRVSYDLKGKSLNIKGAGSRGTCALCSSETNVWCSFCHTWLCGPHVERQYEGIDAVVRLHDAQKFFCYNTCWITWHQEGL